MKKRFGIDIDGTVTSPSSMVPFLNRDFKLDITLNDIKEYDLLHLVQIPRKDFADWFNKKEPEIYSKSPISEGAKEVLSQWSNIHDLYFISARGEHLLDVTTEWFTKHEIHYNHIELIGSHDKIASAKKHKVDLFFEDKYDNAINIHEACQIPVLLFNTPYNQKPLPKGVIRVNNWDEASAWVKQWLSDTK